MKHGEPRLTKDIDVTLGVDVDALPRVLAVIASAGLHPLVDPEPFVAETMVLPCEDPESGIRVDLIFSFSPFERAALERTIETRIGTSVVRFASAEDLVVLKVTAGRPRDLDDVAAILAKNPKLDRAYVRRWVAVLEEAVERPLGAALEQLFARVPATRARKRPKR